jgi:hypothetical protein
LLRTSTPTPSRIVWMGVRERGIALGEPRFEGHTGSAGESFWFDGLADQENIEIDFLPARWHTLASWSAAHVRDRLAIVLDGAIVVAPVTRRHCPTT